MPKGKKQKKANDDDWENDLEAIAAEAGIDRSDAGNTDVFTALVVSKKEKKKKQKEGDDCGEEKIEVNEGETRESQEEPKSHRSDAVDSWEDIAENGDDDIVNARRTKETTADESHSQQPDKYETKSELPAAVAELDVEAVAEPDANPAEQKTVKTAAQKKAEKKEREKKKREAQQTKQKKHGQQTDELEIAEREPAVAAAAVSVVDELELPVANEHPTVRQDQDNAERDDKKKKKKKKKQDKETTEVAVVEEAESMVEGKQADVEEDVDEEGGDEDDKKKKKKKKKKGEKEKEVTAAKGKGKKGHLAMVQQIREVQEKLKQEEERLKAEEEARQKEQEEKERLEQEKLRLEQERKEKRKQKKKEREERLKREGKLLSQAEKDKRARQQQYLQTLKAQGVHIPGLAEQGQGGEDRRRVKYDRRRRQKPGQKPTEGTSQNNSEEVTPNTSEETLQTTSEETPQTTSEERGTGQQGEETGQREGVPAKEESLSEDEVKDNWDDVSDDEPEVAAVRDEQKEKSSREEMAVNKEVVVGEKVADTRISSDESSSSEEESLSQEESDSEDDSSDEEDKQTAAAKVKARVQARIQKRREEAEKNRSKDRLRAPVVCVLGHVDTGKTKILDKLRNTKVQDGEAGGITQQIGATNIPADSLRDMTKHIKEFSKADILLPGLLIIDTPGHESFSNLRTRGSSLCDIAILVVDIMHGLEPQTLESLSLLKQKKTPFIVALNKIDRLYEWLRNPHQSVTNTIKKQKAHTQEEFRERAQEVMLQFSENGMNTALFYENKDPRTYVSLVPTSAISGDGMGDLIGHIVELSQKMLAPRLAYSDELQCHVMEVKVIGGLGTTIDVILVNGTLNEGDTLILCSLDGPYVTQARALLMPQPLKELRVKNAWVNHKQIMAAQGVKLCGKDLERTLAGTQVLVAQQPDEIEVLKEELQAAMSEELKSIKLSEKGVYVQASTLGSLEALLEFLKTSKIPYSGVNIGPIHKKDIMKASAMLEHDEQYAVVLAFDVRVERDAQEMAESLKVKIFTADIIYHLFDQFTAYREEYKQRKQEEYRHIAVFPCKLRILPNCIFNTRDPIVVGVYVEAGILRSGAPLSVPSREYRDLGIVSSIEANHKPKESARAGEEVCIKIEPLPGSTPELYGRHFTHEDLLVSRISRESIDAVKNYFRDDMQKSDWHLMVELKKTFKIL
ncbi:eukaryotic translation initiation factor 5B-like [Corticium candelabrum]|uniref:eukaryotic translation initiation factor 5B-like n=1 Tax=Corticium candelabrum TaxID=121492 RepID=UPI002E2537F1|nr:eukaryotic translation initiation factor 5B-like [Corticium candelabrum]